jgi:hypothetical protein
MLKFVVHSDLAVFIHEPRVAESTRSCAKKVTLFLASLLGDLAGIMKNVCDKLCMYI